MSRGRSPKKASTSKPRVTTLRIGADDLLVISAPLEPDSGLEGVTPAEREVALLILDGKSNREIALARECAERTVANIAASIYRKLGVHTRAELARRVTASEDET